MNAESPDPVETLTARLAVAEREIANLRQGYLVLHQRHAQALALIDDLKATLAKYERKASAPDDSAK